MELITFIWNIGNLIGAAFCLFQFFSDKSGDRSMWIFSLLLVPLWPIVLAIIAVEKNKGSRF